MPAKPKSAPAHASARAALDAARASGGEASILFHLRPPSALSAAPLPDDTRALARRLVDAAAKRSKSKAGQCQIFENLGSMLVRAHPDLLEHLLDQPEVASASVTPQETGPLEPVRPVRKGKPKSTGWADSA